jgi:hypothetical protein
LPASQTITSLVFDTAKTQVRTLGLPAWASCAARVPQWWCCAALAGIIVLWQQQTHWHHGKLLGHAHLTGLHDC